MASSVRTLRLAQRAPQVLSRAAPTSVRMPMQPRVANIQKRLLNTDSAPVLYSASAKVIGARTGHVQGDDLVVDLTMAKALGGPGDKGKTNPEELFAAGYGACFQSAMNASASSMKIRMPKKPEDSVVETTVHLVGDMKGLDMGLRVDMKVRVKGLSNEEVQKVVDKAKEVCPYSRATKGNVTTNVEVVKFDENGDPANSKGNVTSGGSGKSEGKSGKESGEVDGVRPTGHSDYQ
ncbi:organic hydroperoxide resistance protein [Colletotrichum tofieldiae]|uniref:Organic hydroperoxide resistance protein n=1 Tax=Colletotrichum tofieldiae TaxID=708197 RepID=A0A166Y0U1_9PEZI|nr:organic hydroperoxide resistance protein [Colletotrichum tofieldiae]GKT53920.1 organic hydroperoxide resistance protein [Colletotrichum tofieldiae]GKT73657.1 organic hydroperoxide resistance protein [Colletotrichum tofieldiae]GKT95607.1 organic hydroperoxide resistance protein [Colletotrichum tofieldiae]